MKKTKVTLLSILGVALLTTGLYSCNNDDATKETEQSKKESNVAHRESENVYKMTIDNGLDGDVLVFKDEAAFNKIEDGLYDHTQSYVTSVMDNMPTGLTEEEQDSYLDSIGFDEDKLYKEFEDQFNFNSLRKDLNVELEKWEDNQTNPEILINEENDPDNHPLVLEVHRTLFNVGGEVIVLNNEAQPVIYKMFDWGSIEITNLDTDILKQINTAKIKNYDAISSLVSHNTNYKINFSSTTPNDSPCASSGINHKKYNYSSTTGQQVKSFTKQMVIPFTSGKQLVAKTKGYQYKRGKWRNRKVWLQVGITGSKSAPNVPAELYVNGCHNPFILNYVKATTEKRYKHEARYKNYDYIYLKNNKVYSYHGQNSFVFTKDFFPPSHEIYVISN